MYLPSALIYIPLSDLFFYNNDFQLLATIVQVFYRIMFS